MSNAEILNSYGFRRFKNRLFFGICFACVIIAVVPFVSILFETVARGASQINLTLLNRNSATRRHRSRHTGNANHDWLNQRYRNPNRHPLRRILGRIWKQQIRVNYASYKQCFDAGSLDNHRNNCLRLNHNLRHGHLLASCGCSGTFVYDDPHSCPNN